MFQTYVKTSFIWQKSSGEKMSSEKRMERALKNGVVLPLCKCSKYVVFGDCHRGIGNMSDNFLRNQHLYFAALEHYYSEGFYYLELGDGEELWENRDAKQIRECHKNVYCKFECFQRRKKFCRIYGNHDMELKKELPESILLKNQEGGRDLCIIHGHQADFFNSVCWRLSRFLVRYCWKPLELFGVNDPTSAARNYKKVEKYEKTMVKTAEEKNIYLLAGHSHRPHLMDDALYVNAGSCVHPWGITAVEIENMRMNLVKWFMGTKKDGILFVQREVLKEGVRIS